MDQMREIVELVKISGPGDTARPVKLTVVVQSKVRPWRFPPTRDFLYGEWLRDELQAGGPPPPEPMPRPRPADHDGPGR